MKILLFKNTQITEKRVLLIGLEAYLSTFDLHWEINLNKRPETWADKITPTSFEEIFDNFEDLENVDLAVVQDFPFFKNKKYLFFNVENISFNTNKQFRVKFTLNLILSFKIEEVINLDRFVLMQQGHLRQNINYNFSNLENLEIRENAFFRKEQLLQDTEKEWYISKNAVKNDAETQIENIYKFKKWVVCYMKTEFFQKSTLYGDDIEILVQEKSTETTENQNIPFNYLVIVFPYSHTPTNFFGVIDDVDDLITPLYDPRDFTVLDGHTIYELLQKEPTFVFGHIMDHLPLQNINIDETNRITGLNCKVWNTSFEELELKIYLPFIQRIKRDDILVNHYIDRKLFNFEIKEDKWEDENDFSWNKNQESVINFSPYKNYEIGLFSESPGNGFSFQFNNIRYTNSQISNFIKIGHSYELSENDEIYTLSDYLENSDLEENQLYNSQAFFKLKRDLQIPFNTDNWLNYLSNKALGGFQDFLPPIISASLAAFIPGGKITSTLLAGIGVKTFNTTLSRKGIKKSPDPISGTASGINSEIMIGYNTKTLKENKLIGFNEQETAFLFHKFGYYLFEEHYLISQILLSRSRFVFFQVSQKENEQIFNSNLPIFLREKYLNLLKEGVHFWNFYEINTYDKLKINDYIFKY